MSEAKGYNDLLLVHCSNNGIGHYFGNASKVNYKYLTISYLLRSFIANTFFVNL